jgi:sigma-B regulation protein RsbU (phosphoserine phosphatase)
VTADAHYEDEESHLAPGDSLLLFSDGLDETRNDQGEEFGMERLLQTASRSVPNGIRAAVEGLRLHVEEFRKLEPQRDDITIVGLSVE